MILLATFQFVYLNSSTCPTGGSLQSSLNDAVDRRGVALSQPFRVFGLGFDPFKLYWLKIRRVSYIW